MSGGWWVRIARWLGGALPGDRVAASGGGSLGDCPEGVVPLDSVREGEMVEVLGIGDACAAYQQRRLLDLGFVPGSAVCVDLVSPLGNPVAYLVHGCSIALRHDQARHILVRRLAPLEAKG